jgi:hypothetical protein
MRRREFIAGLGSMAAWPRVARAQPGDRVRRIGVLWPGDENDPRGEVSPLRVHASACGLGLDRWPTRSFLAVARAGFPIDGLDRFASSCRLKRCSLLPKLLRRPLRQQPRTARRPELSSAPSRRPRSQGGESTRTKIKRRQVRQSDNR